MTPRDETAHEDDRGSTSIPSADVPPVPDEDGPHDVPDETVIEKTLPSVPVQGSS